MEFGGTRRRRLQHAHRHDRSGRTRAIRPRLAVSVPLVLAVAAALLLAGRPAAPAGSGSGSGSGLTAGAGLTALGDRSAMDLDPRVARTAQPVGTTSATASPPVAPVVASTGRAVVDDAAYALLSAYRWPLEHARITQGFGPSAGGLFIVDGHHFHDGIDIANFCGAPVLAAHDGVVIGAGRGVNAALGWTGDVAGYDAHLTAKGLWGTLARTVVIDDGNGFRSVYIHFHRIDVKVGQVVRAGEVIGLEGSSGHATGCHLHYSLYSVNDPGRWKTNPTDVERSKLPSGEIARVDPILFLPSLATGWITWGWGASDGGATGGG